MLSRKPPHVIAALESIASLNMSLQRKTDINMISVNYAHSTNASWRAA